VDKSNAMDVDESGKNIVFWRQDFEYLFKNGGYRRSPPDMNDWPRQSSTWFQKLRYTTRH